MFLASWILSKVCKGLVLRCGRQWEKQNEGWSYFLLVCTKQSLSKPSEHLPLFQRQTSLSSSLLSPDNGVGWKAISLQTSVKRDHLGDKWQTTWLLVCWVLKGISEEVLWSTCLGTLVKLEVQMENSSFCFMADLEAMKPQGCQVKNMSWTQAPAEDGKEQLAGKMRKYNFLSSASLSVSLSPYIITYIKWPIPSWRMITIHCALVLVQKATTVHCCLSKTLISNYSCPAGQIYIAGPSLSASQTGRQQEECDGQCRNQLGETREWALAGGTAWAPV